RHLQQALLNFGLGHAIVDCTTNMDCQFFGSVECCDHSEVENATAATIQTRTAPDLTPAEFGDQFLHGHAELVGIFERGFDIAIANYCPPNLQALFEAFLVHFSRFPD